MIAKDYLWNEKKIFFVIKNNITSPYPRTLKPHKISRMAGWLRVLLLEMKPTVQAEKSPRWPEETVERLELAATEKKKLRLTFSLHVILSRLHWIWLAQPFIDSDLLPQVDMLLSLPEQNGKTNQEWSNNLFLGLFFFTLAFVLRAILARNTFVYPHLRTPDGTDFLMRSDRSDVGTRHEVQWGRERKAKNFVNPIVMY